MVEKYFKFLTTNKIFNNFSEREIFTYCIAVCLLVLTLILKWKFGQKKYKLPPGPVGLPILGYLPFLGSEPFKKLDKLKEKYGSVFSLYIGRTYTVILGDYEAVKDAFGKSTTIDRPEGLFDFIPDSVGLSSVNGLEWAEQRKFCVKTMREHGIGKDRWESMVLAEVEDFVQFVSSLNGQPTDIFDALTSSVSNNISSFIFGKRLPYNDPDRKFLDNILDDVMMAFSQSDIYSFYPGLRRIAVALGVKKLVMMRRKLERFNNFVKKYADKFKSSFKNEEHENFIVDYLKEMDNYKNKLGHYFNDTNLHGNIQALFLGGSETTRNSLHWLFLIMAKFPDIQVKVHSEIDSVLGKDGQIQWSNRKKIPYTYGTIMEGQRFITIAPINTARIAMEDIKIQGYDIPKGTRINANNWGLHNDSRYWKNPERFDPERFLTEDGKDVITKPESYVPFSYGKRNCPGETIAMMEILLYFTTLMQKFTISPPKGKEINMEGKLGLTYQAFRQDLQFLPRK